MLVLAVMHLEFVLDESTIAVKMASMKIGGLWSVDSMAIVGPRLGIPSPRVT